MPHPIGHDRRSPSAHHRGADISSPSRRKAPAAGIVEAFDGGDCDALAAMCACVLPSYVVDVAYMYMY